MRNLKRALSLALAAIMLLGMMVVGAGAVNLDEFSDKEDIVNKDAVSLLTTLGIINGKEDGSFFDPNGNVTRAEMAKMISVILNKGTDNNDLYVGAASSLTDVKGHWAEGHINYCSSLGIIAGRGDGTFDPGATVTASEAAKMLLVAVGYNAEIERFVGGDWAVNVNAKASALGIFNGFGKNVTAPLNRDDAALLIYNALDVERIQQYSGNYALVYSDRRTILGEVYGVYKLKGVVTGNKWAQLDGTEYDDCLADGKTRITGARVFASNTLGTNTGNSGNANNNNVDIKLNDTEIFNVDTPVEYLGQTVTMYVRKTTVLNDYEVLGVQLREEDNTVVKTAEIIDFKPADNTLKTLLKGTGLTVKTDKDNAPEYYVNYGVVANEDAANDVLKLPTAKVTEGDKITSNKYGVELTVIDNNRDGNVDYVLWLQEDLTQITGVSSARKTVTFLAEQDKDITSYNGGRAIDEDDIVFVDEAKEGDIVLVRTYGGRYYVSQPEVVTGKMDSYSADKTKEQYIVVDGETYHASYINTTAGNEVDNIYTFDIKKCAEKNNDAAVQWEVTYDFYMDSNGHIAAFKPSEKLVPNYALILESGYNPGVYASDASGKVTVLLSDGTEATYELNFSTSAANLRKQIATYNKAEGNNENTATNDGIAELKGFLGTDYTDNSYTRPWNNGTPGGTDYSNNDYIFATGSDDPNDFKAGKAAGWVITYTLNSDDVLTIQSVVGTFDTAKAGYNLGAYVGGKVKGAYDKGDAVIKHTDVTNPNNKTEIAIDKDTVAFYYLNADDYGVVVGYDNITSMDSDSVKFLATNVGAKYRNGAYVAPTDPSDPTETVVNDVSISGGTNLAEMVLFNKTAPESKKDFVYILGRNNHYESGKYVTLFGVGADGKAIELKVERDEWESIFDNNDGKYDAVYEYSTNSSGVTKLTETHTKVPASTQVLFGYAIKLQNGTVAFNPYTNGLPGQDDAQAPYDKLPTDSKYTTSYALAKENQVWNVTDLEIDTDAPKGTFSLTKAKHAIIVLNKANGTKIDIAYVWDILPEEENAGLSVSVVDGDDNAVDSTTNAASITATESITLTAAAADAAGTPSYAWYESTSAGAKGTKLNSTNTLTVNGADLTVGDHYYLVEVTDRSNDVAQKLVKVTVGAAAPGQSIKPTNLKLYNEDGTELAQDTSFGQTGVYKLPADGKIVVVNTNTDFDPNGKYMYNNKMYTSDGNKRITIPVADLEGKDTIANSDFTRYYVLNLSDGVTVAEHADVKVLEGVTYFKKDSANVALTLPTGATHALVVGQANKDNVTAPAASADVLTGAGLTLANTKTVEDLWVKVVAAVDISDAGIKTAQVGNTTLSDGDFVAKGQSIVITSKKTGDTGMALTGGEVVKATVTGGTAAAVEGGTAYVSGTPGPEKEATATYTMTEKAVTFTIVAP